MLGLMRIMSTTLLALALRMRPALSGMKVGQTFRIRFWIQLVVHCQARITNEASPFRAPLHMHMESPLPQTACSCCCAWS